ncbi:MAG: hypothetical protein HMLIMOIP_000933 [Candidatus Nitrosomirales archaeon]|jgi:hypothetical protein
MSQATTKTERAIILELTRQLQNSPRVKEQYELAANPTGIFNGMKDSLRPLSIIRRYPDILVLDRKLQRGLKRKRIMAIEVKYFRAEHQYVAYEGIDQAASLLLYGFDYVSLFHIYDYELQNKINRGQLAWQTIRMQNIPIDFTLFLVKDFKIVEDFKQSKAKFWNIVASWEEGKLQRGKRVGDAKYEFNWKYQNLLRNEIILKRMRELQKSYKKLRVNAEKEIVKFRKTNYVCP